MRESGGSREITYLEDPTEGEVFEKLEDSVLLSAVEDESGADPYLPRVITEAR